MKGTDPSYWICTLANNQHRVDLGSTWKDQAAADSVYPSIVAIMRYLDHTSFYGGFRQV